MHGSFARLSPAPREIRGGAPPDPPPQFVKLDMAVPTAVEVDPLDVRSHAQLLSRCASLESGPVSHRRRCGFHPLFSRIIEAVRKVVIKGHLIVIGSLNCEKRDRVWWIA